MTDLTLGDNPDVTAEVDPQEQALMALKLEENVRLLIRSEVKLALESYDFTSSLTLGPFYNAIVSRFANDIMFRQAVRDAMTSLMQRSS